MIYHWPCKVTLQRINKWIILISSKFLHQCVDIANGTLLERSRDNSAARYETCRTLNFYFSSRSDRKILYLFCRYLKRYLDIIRCRKVINRRFHYIWAFKDHITRHKTVCPLNCNSAGVKSFNLSQAKRSSVGAFRQTIYS